MPKLIKLTNDAVDLAMLEFKKQLTEQRNTSNRINFSLDTNTFLRKEVASPTVKITAIAYLKMRAMVENFDKEIAWHGVVNRVDDTTFIIEDVMCYPQKVSAAAVESDDDRYPRWLMNLTDDEINKLRFQGHSHVHMGVGPSGTDLMYWDKMLQNLTEEDYYIFCIINKKNDQTWRVFDLRRNIIFEDKEVNVEILLNNEDVLHSWYAEAVAENIPAPTPVVTSYVPSVQHPPNIPENSWLNRFSTGYEPKKAQPVPSAPTQKMSSKSRGKTTAPKSTGTKATGTKAELRDMKHRYNDAIERLKA